MRRRSFRASRQHWMSRSPAKDVIIRNQHLTMVPERTARSITHRTTRQSPRNTMHCLQRRLLDTTTPEAGDRNPALASHLFRHPLLQRSTLPASDDKDFKGIGKNSGPGMRTCRCGLWTRAEVCRHHVDTICCFVVRHRSGTEFGG